MVFYMLSPANKYFSTLTKKTSDLLSRFWGIDKIDKYLPSRYSPKVKWLALAERWYLTPYLPILWYKCGHVKHRSTKATVLVFVVCYLLYLFSIWRCQILPFFPLLYQFWARRSGVPNILILCYMVDGGFELKLIFCGWCTMCASFEN